MATWRSLSSAILAPRQAPGTAMGRDTAPPVDLSWWETLPSQRGEQAGLQAQVSLLKMGTGALRVAAVSKGLR